LAIAAGKKTTGLRERKKQRTRFAIVDAAMRLFGEQGYQQTTLAQIAEAADVALSTFFNYFPAKVDVVFALWDVAIESAQQRIAERPAGEQSVDAIAGWLTEDLPEVEQPYERAIQQMRGIVESAPELAAEERLRQARLEDILAEAFARDLGDSPDGTRPRVLAAIALRGMLEAWNAWFEKHANEADFHLDEALAAKSEYVMHLLKNGLEYIDLLEPATLKH
jgi:AcrR family transcriptional regulator